MMFTMTNLISHYAIPHRDPEYTSPLSISIISAGRHIFSFLFLTNLTRSQRHRHFQSVLVLIYHDCYRMIWPVQGGIWICRQIHGPEFLEAAFDEIAHAAHWQAAFGSPPVPLLLLGLLGDVSGDTLVPSHVLASAATWPKISDVYKSVLTRVMAPDG